ATMPLPQTQKRAAEYVKRSGGRNFDASAAYTYEALLVMADVLERAGSTDPDVLVAAIRKTSFAGGVTTATGPVVFNELGDKSQRQHGRHPGPRRQAARRVAQGRRRGEVRLPAPEGLSAAATSRFPR